MVDSVGKRVKKLKRIRIENIHLRNLQEGEIRHLTESRKKSFLIYYELAYILNQLKDQLELRLNFLNNFLYI